MLSASPFLEQVVEEYLRARRLRREHAKVTRGESRSVSADVEDLFALAVAEAFPSIDHIYVNQTLTSTAGRADGRMKPDLVICKGQEVRLLLDLKMDLGYKREDFTVAAALRAEAIQALRGKTVSLWRKENDTRKKFIYSVASTVTYGYVVITDDNIKPEAFREIQSCIGALPELRIFTLVTGTHLNLYDRSESEAKSTVLQHASHGDFASLSQHIADAAF